MVHNMPAAIVTTPTTTDAAAAAAAPADVAPNEPPGHHYFRDQPPAPWIFALASLFLFTTLAALLRLCLARRVAARRAYSPPPSYARSLRHTPRASEHSASPDEKKAHPRRSHEDLEAQHRAPSHQQPPPPPYQPAARPPAYHHHHHHHHQHPGWAPPPPPYYCYYQHFPCCSAIMGDSDRNQVPDSPWGPRRGLRDPYPPAPSYPHYRGMASRPPPAPPLTPPELSSTVFSLQDSPHAQDSFIHQPNPDYASQSAAEPEPEPEREAESRSESQSSPAAAPTPQPRRFSYNKTIAVGGPSSAQTSRSGSIFSSPNSFLSGSTLTRSGPDGGSSGPREIDVHGEIISMLDQNGNGWSRHTRVYGGGACLACATSHREHGEGGFYGPNVLPEEMRY